MTKTEFLDTLRLKLAGEVPASEIDSTIRYYDEYISETVGRGEPESQVLEELGSPLLIARTIIDTSARQEGNSRKTPYDRKGTAEQDRVKYYHLNVNPGMAKLVAVLIFVAVLVLAVTVLRILIPILLPVLLVWMIVAIFQNGGRRR
ncbi:DUF1700 domain-containing protein [Lachnospiraceae bacterium 46-15]